MFNNKFFQIRETCYSILFITLICITSGCSKNNKSPLYWPKSETIIEHSKWELPLKDSLNILTKTDYKWQLPEPADTINVIKYKTVYREPQLNKYQKHFGRIDQEVLHSTNENSVEFYRFEKGSVYFIGFVSLVKNGKVVKFEPALNVLPQQIFTSDSTFKCTGKMKTLIPATDKFDEGLTTAFIIKPIEQGINNSGKKSKLFEITMTSDASVGFGEQNLIVPEAILLSNKILIAEDEGTMLEWGIRSREKENKSFDNNSISNEQPERELFFEIIKNRILK